jgi:hypothetical protein
MIEADRLREICGIRERENAEGDNKLRNADHDLYKLQERAQELQKTAELREKDLRRTSEAYETAHLDLLKARDE